ncbi:MAG: hypothetical protein IJ226_02610 [Clostridia bacterium]|nr:hypothetical protein [Clostridia bacterium]
MPNMSKEAFKDVKYVSMVDFCRRIDEIQDIDDKREFATKYLLTYGMNGAQQDYSLNEAIHIARVKLADAGTALRNQVYDKTNGKYQEGLFIAEDHPETINAYAKTRADDVANEMFMGRPGEYLQNRARISAQEIVVPNENVIGATDERDHYLNMANRLGEATTTQVFALDDNSNAFDVKFRMEAKFGSRQALERIVKNTKAGFFSRVFRTSSAAGKNLESTYKAFNDPNGDLHGNLDAVERAGEEYLKHKFPGWKPGKPFPTAEQLDRLDATSKARAMLSIGLIEAAKAQRPVVGPFWQMTEGSTIQDISYKDVIDAEAQAEASLKAQKEAAELQAQKEKEEFFKGVAEAEAETSLKGDSAFLDEVADKDNSKDVYATGDENPLEEDIVNAVDKFGESYTEQQHFQEQFKSDLEMDDSVHIDTAKQEAEANGLITKFSEAPNRSIEDTL